MVIEQKVWKVLHSLSQEVERKFGSAFLSLIVFGSLVHDDFVSHFSDINHVIVLRDGSLGPGAVQAAEAVIHDVRKLHSDMPAHLQLEFIVDRSGLGQFNLDDRMRPKPVDVVDIKTRGLVIAGAEIQARILMPSVEEIKESVIFLLYAGNPSKSVKGFVNGIFGAALALYMAETGDVVYDKSELAKRYEEVGTLPVPQIVRRSADVRARWTPGSESLLKGRPLVQLGEQYKQFREMAIREIERRKLNQFHSLKTSMPGIIWKGRTEEVPS